MLRMSWHVVITVLSNADKHINKCIEGSCMFMAKIVISNYLLLQLGEQIFSVIFQHSVCFHFQLVSEMKWKKKKKYVVTEQWYKEILGLETQMLMCIVSYRNKTLCSPVRLSDSCFFGALLWESPVYSPSACLTAHVMEKGSLVVW